MAGRVAGIFFGALWLAPLALGGGPARARRGGAGMAGRIAAFALAAICVAVLALASGPAGAAGERRDPGTTSGEATARGAYAQAQRARTRIRVSPRCYYRTRALDYPPPYECE